MPAHLSTPPKLPTPWPPPVRPLDLEEPAKVFAQQRPDDRRRTTGGYRRCVQLLESTPADVLQTPLVDMVGAVDGVQKVALLGRAEAHRDLLLISVIAGCVKNEELVAPREEMLAVVCSELDAGVVRAKAPHLPILALPETTPWGLAAAADDWTDHTRRTLELRAIASAPVRTGQVLMVDGPLPHESDRKDAVGIVKEALDTPWLTDPTHLPTDAGSRSPAFRIPASRTDERSKVSALVRLHTAGAAQSWGHGLIRVEVYEDGAVTIDQAAALAVRHRGTPAYGDSRWLIQPRPLFECEQVLKHFPLIVDILAKSR